MQFHRFANGVSRAAGSPWAFLGATASVVAWLAVGPWFGWSDSYQLIANTFTTLATYLMVFVLQNAQNRNSEAQQLKLDALIRANRHLSNRLMFLEQMDDEQLEQIKRDFERDVESTS